MPILSPLPIDAVLGELFDAVRRSNCVVLQAPTGAGKTTRVPTGLLDSDSVPKQGQILLLEPRRLAARAAARRMAFERGCNVGEVIGYQVRFDQRSSPRTRILAITDGVLIRKLQTDPFLESVSAILFDEFHERSLNADLGLAMARRVQQTVRPDLKLIVMSATLSAGPVSRFLGGCPIITSEGRLHPVDIRYQPQTSTLPLVEQAARAVCELSTETAGDILVFLPGVREIHQTSKLLTAAADREQWSLMPLYGDMSPEQQDQVLNPLESGRRKIVLATNVAETSVTIEGITGVVDTGQVRQLQFDPGLGLDRLVLTRISQASADQRAGRAGRTRPGVCVRLWMEREQRGLVEQTEPEVRRVDIAGPILELLCWGETDLAAFPWFEAPRPEALSQALILLERLGAIEDGLPTELAQQMTRLPVHPRLSRMLLEGLRLRIPDRVAWIAALLAERDPFERQSDSRGSARGPMHYSMSDILDRVQALEEFHRHGRAETSLGRLNLGAARFLQQSQQQLMQLLQDCEISDPQSSRGRDSSSVPGKARNKDDAVLRSVLTAFPDRVARRREHLSRKGVMVGGRGVRLLDSSPVLEPDFFVCVETDAGQGESVVRLASGIEREWLPADAIQSGIEVSFDDSTEKITALRRTRYLDLVIDEGVTTVPSDVDVAAVLAEAALQKLDRAIPTDAPELNSFLSRVRCLKAWIPNCDLPDFGSSVLADLLPVLCRNCRSFADLRKASWLDALKGSLSYQQLQFLDKEAPERLRVPSGSLIALEYEVGRAPILAVRIQELFGLAETPRIARGQIRVVLHLLGPNYRPQQITDDLQSFWNNTYPEVRKELKRRYPKHAWPEDPWTATAERRPGKK